MPSDVGNNHLTGTLRDLIRNRAGFPSLRNLYVDVLFVLIMTCNFTNIYIIVCVVRYLNNNQMSGGLPDQLANLTNLEIL